MHVHIGHIVQNALYFFTKISSLLLGRDRTKFSVMMNKVYIVHVSMKIVNFRTPGSECGHIDQVNFLTPGVRVLVLGCGQFSHWNYQRKLQFDPGCRDLDDLGHKSMYILCISCRCPFRHMGLLFILCHAHDIKSWACLNPTGYTYAPPD